MAPPSARCYLGAVGQADLFAKQTFAEETERLTRGAIRWQDPAEIGLVKLLKVQGDGLYKCAARTAWREWWPRGVTPETTLRFSLK